MGRDEPEPVVRHGAEPARIPGRTAGGSRAATPLRSPRVSAISASAPTRAARSGCPSSCCGLVGLKPSWGRIPTDGVFPLCPSFDTVGPDGDARVADVALDVVGARRGTVPEPRLAGLTVGLLTQPPSVGGPPAAGEPRRGAVRRAAGAARRARRRGDDPGAARRHLAALLPRGGRVAPGDVPGAGRRVRRERAREARPRADGRARGGRRAHATPFATGASTGPTSTSTSRRSSVSTCRRSTATSSTCASR